MQVKRNIRDDEAMEKQVDGFRVFKRKTKGTCINESTGNRCGAGRNKSGIEGKTINSNRRDEVEIKEVEGLRGDKNR